jgi:hypothetical protein
MKTHDKDVACRDVACNVSTINYEQIKERLSPCGLHCGKCFAFADGDIKKNSTALLQSLGNFGPYASRFTELLNEPVFANYPQFNELLTLFSTIECKGCRKEKCKLFSSCKVRDCHEQMKVDFCFQCSEFPCNNTGFDENLYKRSVEINHRMKSIGVEAYYNEVKDRPRY